MLKTLLQINHPISKLVELFVFDAALGAGTWLNTSNLLLKHNEFLFKNCDSIWVVHKLSALKVIEIVFKSAKFKPKPIDIIMNLLEPFIKSFQNYNLVLYFWNLVL